MAINHTVDMAAKGREAISAICTAPSRRATFRASAQQKVFFENTARAMGDAPKEVEVGHVGNCLKADPAYGEGVAKALGIATSDVTSSK